MNPPPKISVAVAAHNPRQDYFVRCIGGLRNQTLRVSDWELVVIDNMSTPGLAESLDLSWHPAGRVVLEDRLGLVFSRCRGFSETKAPIVVNVDDDCVLESRYLQHVLKLASEFPFVGVFGAQIRADFEESPTKPPREYYAAERIVTENLWSNLRESVATTPWGAGSVLRRCVADRYLQRVAQDPRLLELGRRGNSLLSCEDVDIANAACDLGLGKGVFKDLVITHLIPASKMTDEFTAANAYWNTYSAVIHNFIQFSGIVPARRSWQNRILTAMRGMFRDRLTRRIMRDEIRAEEAAVRDLRSRGWI